MAPVNTLPEIPLHPPLSWLTEMPKGLKAEGRKYIGSAKTGDYGRISSYIFEFGKCLEEGPAECWLPPRSQNNFEFFHNGTAITKEGKEISVGTVGIIGGHPDLGLTAEQASAIYGKVENQRMYGTLQQNDIGVYFTGCFTTDTTPAEIEIVRRSPFSADFRWRNRMPVTGSTRTIAGYDMIGFIPVTRPGFPMARAAALASLVDPSHRAKITVPYGADFQDPTPEEAHCCTTCEEAAMAELTKQVQAKEPINITKTKPSPKPARIAAVDVSSLQVGVDGFQGFEDAPIGNQIEGLGLSNAGADQEAAAAPVAPGVTPAEFEGMETKVRELSERVDELEALMTSLMIQGAPAPELILNEDNMLDIEEFDSQGEASGGFGTVSRIAS